MSIDINSIEEVFWEGPSTIIDAVHPVTGLGLWGGKAHPECERITFDEALKRQAEHWRSPPVEITERQFIDALEVLPPVDWCNWTQSESFKISEMTSGTITAIYCRIGSHFVGARWYCLSDSVYLPHDEIVAKCRAVTP